MFKRLLPKTSSFFEFFEQHSWLSREVCAELDALADNQGNLESHARRIKELEHEADSITRSCIEGLHNTFITPIDRSDIHRLIRRLDDVIDSVNSIAARMVMYRITSIRPEMRQLTQILIEAVDAIDKAVKDLPLSSKKGPDIHKCCWEVYEAESRADAVLSSALVHLLDEERDPILIIKWKEIFERLERATDRCQEVAHIISGIVIEAS
jgi:predicted phosphate transport protein (TIGR00153 family)